VETTAGSGERVLHITAEHDCRRLHCSLRDLSSLLQALGRLSHHFITDDKFTASFDDAYVLVDRFVCVWSHSVCVVCLCAVCMIFLYDLSLFLCVCVCVCGLYDGVWSLCRCVVSM